jgi:L-ribulose-5-phosphate 3-epimerase
MNAFTRRDFITTSAAALAATVSPTNAAESKPKLGPICFFTKPLDDRPVEEVIEIIAAAGYSALDISVRSNGLIKPEKVGTDLPRAAELATRAGLTIPMMVTALGSAKDPFTKEILKTAAAVGVKTYRTNWFDYEAKTPPRGQWPAFRAKLESLTELNRELGLCAAYQNHAGLRVGAGLWDLAEILQGLDPKLFGSQYDIRHATVEGAESWPLALRQIAPHIRCLAIKDFVWKDRKAESVPLGEGLVDFKKYFALVKELGIGGPITMHVEYPVLTSDEKKLSAAEQRTRIIAVLKRDREWLENALKAAGLA